MVYTLKSSKIKLKLDLIIFSFFSILVALLLNFGYNVYRNNHQDTVISHFNDTITTFKVVNDTIPILVEKTHYRTIYDTLKAVDTISKDGTIVAEIPIEKKVYTDSDSTYTAYISGYKPSLDSIKVNQKETIITNTIVKQNNKRFSIGVGVGIGTNFKQITPTIGITLNYDLWRF